MYRYLQKFSDQVFATTEVQSTDVAGHWLANLIHSLFPSNFDAQFNWTACR